MRKSERKTVFGRHRYKFEDNTEICVYIEETGWEVLIGFFWLKRRRSDGVL
jgi:23S rRNA maturation mini-RNase III